MYVLALVVALVVFLAIMRAGHATKFVEGSRTVYEGSVDDLGMTATSLISGNPFFEIYDTRGYMGLTLENGSELCIYTASEKAPDRHRYTFPDSLSVGDHVKITAAKEVGTGLMVVLDTEVLSQRDA